MTWFLRSRNFIALSLLNLRALCLCLLLMRSSSFFCPPLFTHRCQCLVALNFCTESFHLNAPSLFASCFLRPCKSSNSRLTYSSLDLSSISASFCHRSCLRARDSLLTNSPDIRCSIGNELCHSAGYSVLLYRSEMYWSSKYAGTFLPGVKGLQDMASTASSLVS
jgi:hypothetical protein